MQIFETFECSGQNSSNSSLNSKIPSNFGSCFIVMIRNSSVSLKLLHFLLSIKGFHQFWDVRVLQQNLAKFLISFSKPQVSFSSNFASLFNVMKDNPCVKILIRAYSFNINNINSFFLKVVSIYYSEQIFARTPSNTLRVIKYSKMFTSYHVKQIIK